MSHLFARFVSKPSVTILNMKGGFTVYSNIKKYILLMQDSNTFRIIKYFKF